MTADTTLAPCPMPGCGGSARHIKHSAGLPGTMGHDTWHAVACASCGITMGACDRRFRSRKEAAAAWNRRTERQPLTTEQITALWVEHGLDECDPEGFARHIEAAHGITGATNGKPT